VIAANATSVRLAVIHELNMRNGMLGSRLDYLLVVSVYVPVLPRQKLRVVRKLWLVPDYYPSWVVFLLGCKNFLRSS
jgi:hypothetical protein